MTDEAVKKLYKETAPIMERIFKVASTLSAGDCKETTCPVCNGRLFVERSPYNGHIHADCEGCNFSMME